LEEYLSRDRPDLTTTSYAILGLLTLKRWSTYELAKQMRRTFHYFWPRAESNLYAEPKKLVAHGLARADSEPHGKRRRTVYTITPEGHDALARWLREPPDEPRYESEALVKAVFAENGTREDLLNTLHRFREHAITRHDELTAIFHAYVDGHDPYPGRTHINALGSRISLQQATTEVDWANWAIEEVERWTDTAAPVDREPFLDIIRETLRLTSRPR
jgi:PadR family transcriptional regulator AphA